MFNYIKKRIEFSFFIKRAPDAFSSFYKLIENSEVYSLFTQDLRASSSILLNNLNEDQLQILTSKLRKGSKVLDLGCGNGELEKDLFPIEYYGIDLIASNKKNIYSGNFEDFNLEGKTYDYIISIDSLYMMKNLKRLMKKIRSSLKENGRMLIFYNHKLDFKKSDLGRTLSSTNLKYDRINLNQSNINFWKQFNEKLNQYKDDFFKEGNERIYRTLKQEADNNSTITHRSFIEVYYD